MGKNQKITFEPPKNSSKVLSYIWKYKKQFFITAITGIFFNSAIVFGPIFQGKLLDSAIGSKGLKDTAIVGLEFILVTFAFQVARFFKRYFVRDMANRMSGDMRIGIIQSLLSTSLNTIENQKVGDMMTKTIGDVDIVVEAIRKTITEIWDTWVLMIAYFVTLMVYDVKITLISAIPIPLAILLAHFMKKVIHSKSKGARKSSSKTTSEIRKIISDVNILRLYGREEAELKRLNENLKIQANFSAKASVLKNGLGPIYSSIATIGIVLVIVLGSEKVIKGQWTIGTFTAYITMFLALSTRTTTAAKVFNIQQGARASWERVKILIEEHDFKEGNLLSNLNPKTLKLQNLSFKYPTGESYAINNVSFKVEENSIIGITGAVGSGKSALSLAMTGLYEYEGKIFFDEKEIKSIPYNKFISSISYLGHNPTLFSDTLENNITWGCKDELLLNKVISIANLKEDIERLENGLKTQVGERGVKLSGGQKQRIALARALYKDSKIIILDDPFSAVDIFTECKIIKKLKKNLNNKIIFIFSHRLEGFKYTDKVMVLQNGKVVQEGTHEELINIDGIYSKIIDSQNFIGGDINERK